MELFHGSYETITEIRPSAGDFGGIFGASSQQAARSHGEFVHVIVSPLPLSDFELNYQIEGAYAVALEVAGGREDLADAIMEKGCPDCGDYDGIEVQALRGRLASKLGYTSVEMEDEHGTTWLCLPGCTVSPA